VTWPALFGVFLLSHLAGDFLLQTDWQATHKGYDSRPRGPHRALGVHGIMYTVAFVPALVWVAAESGAAAALGVSLLVLLPHIIIDDGRLVGAWVHHVKRVHGTPTTVVRLGVDQTLHLLLLAGVAFLVTG
jgi:hypothetical protein